MPSSRFAILVFIELRVVTAVLSLGGKETTRFCQRDRHRAQRMHEDIMQLTFSFK